MTIFNMQQRRILMLLAFVFLFAHSAMAADDPIVDHPGYVDLSYLQNLAGQDAKVEVNIKSPLLTMLSGFIMHEDRDAAAVVSSLQRVMVQVFVADDTNMNQLMNAVEATGDDLESTGWDRVVTVRDTNDHADVFFKLSSDAELIHGIAVMVVGSRETVLVNVVGDISAADVAAIAQKYNIHHLSDFDECQFDPDAC